MKVRFKNDRLQRTCESENGLKKDFGQKRAKKIQKRLAVLEAAETLEQVPHTPPERRHQLTGNRDEEFAVAIEDQWRIIFRPDHVEMPRKPDGGIDISKVTSIMVIDICEDYH